MFEESTSLLVAAGPESTSRLRSTTQLRRGGTHAKPGFLYGRDKRLAREAGAAWYRSKNPLQLSSVHYPFVGDGYLSNKKWPLNEGSAPGILYEFL